jgi:hypothetical protein
MKKTRKNRSTDGLVSMIIGTMLIATGSSFVLIIMLLLGEW